MLQYLRSVTNRKLVGYFYISIIHIMYSETNQLISTKLSTGVHNEVIGQIEL